MAEDKGNIITLDDSRYRYTYFYGKKKGKMDAADPKDEKMDMADRVQRRVFYGNAEKENADQTGRFQRRVFYKSTGGKDMDKLHHNHELEGGNVKYDTFFLEKDMHPGKKMNLLDLTKPARRATFLSAQVVKSIPFSTDKLGEILKYFSVEANSKEANIIKQTIEDCERPTMEGEDKYCATSLESFVDVAVSKLGKRVQLLSSEVEKETETKEFTIAEGRRTMGEQEIVCHQLPYTYAVFYCHSISNTTVYKVPLVGSDGTKATGMAVCHRDTSEWSPNHVAFELLIVKPGAVPICHFLARQTLIWIPI